MDDSAPADEAVVSQAFASRGKAGDPAVILGHTFTIGARPVIVVGVLPASFSVVDEADIWVLARGVSALAVIGSGDARPIGWSPESRLVSQSKRHARWP